jgi:hypothetical protein
MKRCTLRAGLFSLTVAAPVWAQVPAEAPASAPVDQVPAAPPPAAAAPPAASPAPPPAPAAPPAPPAAPETAGPPTAVVPLSSLPETVAYRRGRAAPEGYVLTEEPRRGFVIGGVAVVGAAYLTGLMVTGVAMDFPNKTAFLAIPVAGPWITLATRDKRCDDDITLDCTGDELARRMLIVDGLVQAVGVGLIAAGMTWTKSVWLREDLASNVEFLPTLNVAASPGLPAPQGMSIVGQF